MSSATRCTAATASSVGDKVTALLTRRTFLLAPLVAPLTRVVNAQSAVPGKMLLSIHQNTSRAAGYLGSLEGWAKAGIQHVELSDNVLEGFLENDTLLAARRVLTDLGLTPVSAAAVLPDIWIPGPARAASLETWRRRCDQFASLGLQKIYSPSITNRRVTAEDFAAIKQVNLPRSGPRSSLKTVANQKSVT